MSQPLALTLDVSAVPERPGGAGYYTFALAGGLSARHDVDLTLIARRGDEARWDDVAGGAVVRAAVPASRARAPIPPGPRSRGATARAVTGAPGGTLARGGPRSCGVRAWRR